MGDINGFKDLFAWQRAIELAGVCFQLVERTPRRLMRGGASQLLEAADSVHMNIAEGYGRSTTPDYLKFLSTAEGSLREVESKLRGLERNRGVTGPIMNRALALCDECGGLLFSLQRSVRASARRNPRHRRRSRKSRGRRSSQSRDA